MFCNNNVWISNIVQFINDSGTINIKPEDFKNVKYDLIITGTIGVGKSTLLQFLSEVLKYNNINFCSYPEFITYEYKNKNIGQDMFEMKMNNIISTFTFQNYILDIWDRLLSENKFNESNTVNLFERIPYDAVYCFSKKEFENGNLSKSEYNLIIERYNEMCKKYNLYDYTNVISCNLENNNIIKTVCEIIKIMLDDISKGVMSRCICLKVSNDDAYFNRLNIRSREGEDKYKVDNLTKFKNYYNDLFK